MIQFNVILMLLEPILRTISFLLRSVLTDSHYSELET